MYDNSTRHGKNDLTAAGVEDLEGVAGGELENTAWLSRRNPSLRWRILSEAW